MTEPPGGIERRQLRRQRVLKGAIVVRGDYDSELPCTVRNMSEAGAKLEVSSQVQLPRAFLLYVNVDGVAYRCELEWRKGENAGVSFHGTEPKPARIYS